MRNILSGKFAIMSYMFFNALLSGLVLVGICSSFALMLSENGVDVATITRMLLATIPYSWKFAISPFIKNLIERHRIVRHTNFDVVKIIAYAMQLIVFSGFSLLGFFYKTNISWLASIVIFFVVLAVSIHDILRAHMKLAFFKTDEFGFVSAVENTGFRLGMFTAGVCIVYIANSVGWQVAFIAAAFAVGLVTIATFFLKNTNRNNEISQETPTNFLKNYIKIGYDFFKTCGFLSLICIIASFKVTDSAINGLKPMFIHFLGINRIAFANIVHVYGLITMTVAGIIAGFAINKFGIKACIKQTFLAQMIVSLIFIYLVVNHDNLLAITILVNIATFVFGFCGVIFRTFIAHISKRDINIYTISLSLGSFIRICTYSIAGFIVAHYSWNMLFIVCMISNISGYFFVTKFLKKSNYKR